MSDTSSQTMSSRFPELARQWHPTENGTLRFDDLTPGSTRKIVWQCLKKPEHVWTATLSNRTGALPTGCPYCAGKRVDATNSLATRCPELAAEFHPTLNEGLNPDQVHYGARKAVWWQCSSNPEHVWQKSVEKRTKRGYGCPFCSNRRTAVETSLATLFPAIAAEWHPDLNGDLTPETCTSGTHKVATWRCAKDPSHAWRARVVTRTRVNSGCPYCSRNRISPETSLAGTHPEIAAEWHPTLNGNLLPEDIGYGSTRRVWWKCDRADDHEWQAVVHDRAVNSQGCPCCSGRKLSATNSIATLAPHLAEEWHWERNGAKTPESVRAISSEIIWWKCKAGPDHEWSTPARDRSIAGHGCPYCSNRRVSSTNSLAILRPDLAEEWHPTRNATVAPTAVTAYSMKKFWWLCAKCHVREWQTTPYHRHVSGTGCPTCNRGWTLSAIQDFVRSLRDHIPFLTQAELFAIFNAAGALKTASDGRRLSWAVANSRLSLADLDRVLDASTDDLPELLDTVLGEAGTQLEPMLDGDQQHTSQPIFELNSSKSEPESLASEFPLDTLPSVPADRILSALDLPTLQAADAETVEFLLSSAVAKLWHRAYVSEEIVLHELSSEAVGQYAAEARRRFLAELAETGKLAVPPGYSFAKDGRLVAPNLMQKHVAVQVRDRRRVGNWSGTGAGKTLSAILASRLIDSKLTLVACPNSVVDGWASAIQEAFPDTMVLKKTFEVSRVLDDPILADQDRPLFVVNNFELFQQSYSETAVTDFIGRAVPDMIIIDEIHFTKQRMVEDLSHRRKVLTALVIEAGRLNPDLAVLGMTATPVINNLREGRSLIELVTGIEHADLEVSSSVQNCMKLHQHLVNIGSRWKPQYQLELNQETVPVDCSEHLDEIRALKVKGDVLRLEQILTKARLPVIRERICRKTLVYTHLVDGIDRTLYDAIADDGWSVGFFTGEDKTGLEGFLKGSIDVLIASSAIATGVDGLQSVCSNLIVNVLPWTAAEFDQLKGRLFRQGQTAHRVDLVVPETYAEISSERWSWCRMKLDRIEFKRSIADAAVDGVVPVGSLRTATQAFQDLMVWLQRLESGEIRTVERKPLSALLHPDEPEHRRRLARYGEFSNINAAWNRASSASSHRRLSESPEEWFHYHSLYQQARADWAVTPYREVAKWCSQRNGAVVGDFGCGFAELGESLKDVCTVVSLDHVAVNDSVIACDLANVPVESQSLDVAVFSLSLMGSNFPDYILEANRCLKLDGHLHIWEASSRFNDRENFVRQLRKFGFDGAIVSDRWKFTHIWMRKVAEPSEDRPELQF